MSDSLQPLSDGGAPLRITGYEVFPVANPTPEFGGPVWMFVRLDSDTGISGYGEVFTSSVYSPPLTFARVIGDFIEEFAVGRDPANIEAFFLSVYNSHYTRSSDLLKMAVTAGVEIAMWDLVGKDLGRPVHALLGGRVHRASEVLADKVPHRDLHAGRDGHLEQIGTARVVAVVHAEEEGLDVRGVTSDGELLDEVPDHASECQRWRVHRRCEHLAVAADAGVGVEANEHPDGSAELGRRIRDGEDLIPGDPQWCSSIRKWL